MDVVRERGVKRSKHLFYAATRFLSCWDEEDEETKSRRVSLSFSRERIREKLTILFPQYVL